MLADAPRECCKEVCKESAPKVKLFSGFKGGGGGGGGKGGGGGAAIMPRIGIGHQSRYVLEHWVLVPQPRHLLEHLVLVPLHHKSALTTMCLSCGLQNDSILEDCCSQSPVWYPSRGEEEDVEAYSQALVDHKSVPF